MLGGVLEIPSKIIEWQKNRLLRRNGSAGRVTADVELRYPQHIQIGARSYVNGGMLAASSHAWIRIGEDCMISYAVHLRTDMHCHERVDVPMNRQGAVEKDIVIGDDVWVGYGAQIMCGVTIGSHSIIGAGAIVTRDIPDYSIAVGVPARVIKSRLDEPC